MNVFLEVYDPSEHIRRHLMGVDRLDFPLAQPKKPSIASQEGRYVLPQRVALESNALLSQPIGVELLSTRCFRKQHVAYIRSDTTRCFHF